MMSNFRVHRGSNKLFLQWDRTVPGCPRPVVHLSRDKTKSLSPCSFVPGQGQQQKSPFSFCPASRPRTGHAVKILTRPVPWQQIKILSWLFPWQQDSQLVPLSWDNDGASVLCSVGQKNPVLLESLVGQVGRSKMAEKDFMIK